MAPGDRAHLLILLTQSLGDEARAEVVLQMFERNFICPKCGSSITERPRSRAFDLDPESIILRSH